MVSEPTDPVWGRCGQLGESLDQESVESSLSQKLAPCRTRWVIHREQCKMKMKGSLLKKLLIIFRRNSRALPRGRGPSEHGPCAVAGLMPTKPLLTL